MIKKKSPPSKLSVILAVVVACVFALAGGYFLKHQLSGQPVEAADAGKPITETQAEPSKIAEPPVDSEKSEILDHPTTQAVNGTEIRFVDAQQEDNTIAVSVCFDLPDDSDWTIWNSTLEIDGNIYRWSEMAPSEIRKPPTNGMQQVWTFKSEGGVDIQSVEVDASQPAYRCETIYFQGIADYPSSIPYTFTIEALEAAPREGEYCTNAYLKKVQAALDTRQTGITVKCVEAEYIGGLEVITKPETMSLETAQAYLISPDFYLDIHGMRGPWVFTFDLNAKK